MAVTSKTATHQRFYLLDGLRGIAALMIVLYHLLPLAHVDVLKRAYISVDFFFCLSGFVIAFSYEERLTDALSLKDFIVTRFIRLYPIYLLGVLLGLVPFLWSLRQSVTQSQGGHLLPLILLQLVMLPNLHVWRGGALFPLNVPAWSLFFELLANVAFAWLVRRKLASSWLLTASALLSGLCLMGWTHTGGTLAMGWNDEWHHLYLGLARVTLSFSLGVLAFRLFRRTRRWRLTPTPQWLIASAIMLFLTFLLLSPLPVLQTYQFQMLTVTLLFPSLVSLGFLSSTPAASTGICAFLGDISYPVYLLHFSFVVMLSKTFAPEFIVQHIRLIAVGFILLITAIANLAVKFYDAPLRRRLTQYYNLIGLDGISVRREEQLEEKANA